MPLQRKKTEMVGSLVLPADMMSHDAATPDGTQHAVQEAVEHFGQDLQHAVNLKKRQTEMYGTLIVDTMDTTATPHSPSTTSPRGGGGGKKIDVVSRLFSDEIV